MAWIRCLVLALAVVAVAAETDLERRALKVVADFRKMMPDGDPDAGIPCLDPATIPLLPIHVDLPVLTADATASDVQVPGVSTFTMTKLAQRGDTNTLDAAVELADIPVTGLYNVVGKAKLGFMKVNVKGSGPLKVAIKGLKGSAQVDLDVTDTSIRVVNLKIQDWSTKSISIKLDNLMGGSAVGNAVNALVNTLIPTFLNANKAKINVLVETKGTEIINKYLDSLAGKPTFAFDKNVIAELFAVAASQDGWVIPTEVEQAVDQIAILAAGLQTLQ